MHRLLVLFAFAAMAQSATIVVPETKITNVPVTRTVIEGPSGSITKEDSVPVVTKEESTIIDQVVPIVEAKSIISHEVPIVETKSVVPVVEAKSIVHHEVPIIGTKSIVPLVHHEVPVVATKSVIPSYEIPTVKTEGIIYDQLPVVETKSIIQNEVPLVSHEIPYVNHQGLSLVRSIPHITGYQYNYPYYYDNHFYNGLYYY